MARTRVLTADVTAPEAARIVADPSGEACVAPFASPPLPPASADATQNPPPKPPSRYKYSSGDKNFPPKRKVKVKPPVKRDATGLSKGQRATAARIALMRMEGRAFAEIADTLGLSIHTVHGYLYRAASQGLFTPDDPEDTLRFRLSHKIVKNVEKALDGDEMVPTQQEMTIQAAKGIGLFRSHEAKESGAVGQMTQLAVKIETPDGGETIVRAGTIGGTPASYSRE